MDKTAYHIDLTVSIVSAYVSSNHLVAAELPALISLVHGALAGLGQTAVTTAPQNERASPAQVRKSIMPDALISFLDGKPYKTLKRHLTKHGLTPQAYRERFGLPADYPTTSANFSAKRSSIAKSIRLGQVAPKQAGA